MALRYKCLILDHDDTAVKSTPEIHYPSMVKSLELLRPNQKPITLEEFYKYSFHPGFSYLLKDILKLSQEEIHLQYEMWLSHTAIVVPDFYPGFPEMLKYFKEQGGIITVVSH